MLIEDHHEKIITRDALRLLQKTLERNIRQADRRGFVPAPGSTDMNRLDLPVARRLLARLNSELDRKP